MTVKDLQFDMALSRLPLRVKPIWILATHYMVSPRHLADLYECEVEEIEGIVDEGDKLFKASIKRCRAICPNIFPDETY